MLRFRQRFKRWRQRIRLGTALTWNPDRENDPLEMLGLWADKWLALETHMSGNSRILGRDHRFQTLLGDCVFRIDLFNAALENKWQTMPGRLDDGNDYPAYARYLEFHNNRIMSRVRQCLFDQTSPKTGGFPFAGVNEQVLELGQALWQGPSGQTRHFKGYPFYLAGYCYLLGLLHGVVVEPFANTGVFLAFEYDAMHFSRLKGRLGAMFQAVDSEYALRRVIHQIKPVLLTGHLKKAGMPPSPGSEFRPALICQQFVHVNRTTPVPLEPLTWHLSGILAAMDGQLGNTLAYETPEIQSSGQQSLVDLVCRFTKQSLDLFERMYGRPGKPGDSEARIQYGEWFDLENRFLSQWLDLIDPVHEKKPHTIEKIIRQMNRKVSVWPVQTIEFTFSHKANRKAGRWETGPESWTDFFSHRHQGVEQIIEALPLLEMDRILRRYAHLGEIHYDRLPDILMGIGGTGTFLAHLVNYFRQTDVPVCAFLTSSNIGYRPESVRLLSPALTNRSDRAVICAGSVKTLFTFAMLEAYFQRHHSLPYMMEIWPFFLYRGDEPVETRTVPVIRPLYSVENGKMILNPPASPFRPRCPTVPVWPGSADLKPDGPGIADCLVVDDSFQPVRIDYARILADTRTTASLALAFAGQIRDIKGRTQGPAYLFSPSPAGRVLALGTGCFLRYMGVEVRFVTSRQAAAEAECHGKSSTFLIDLTRVTGFTAEQAWQTLTHQPWDRPVKIDDLMLPLVASEHIRGK